MAIVSRCLLILTLVWAVLAIDDSGASYEIDSLSSEPSSVQPVVEPVTAGLYHVRGGYSHKARQRTLFHMPHEKLGQLICGAPLPYIVTRALVALVGLGVQACPPLGVPKLGLPKLSLPQLRLPKLPKLSLPKLDLAKPRPVEPKAGKKVQPKPEAKAVKKPAPKPVKKAPQKPAPKPAKAVPKPKPEPKKAATKTMPKAKPEPKKVQKEVPKPKPEPKKAVAKPVPKPKPEPKKVVKATPKPKGKAEPKAEPKAQKMWGWKRQKRADKEAEPKTKPKVMPKFALRWPKVGGKPKADAKKQEKTEPVDTKDGAMDQDLRSGLLPFILGTFAGLGPLFFLLRTRADRERAASACSPVLKIVPCVPGGEPDWLQESNLSSRTDGPNLVKMHQNTSLYRMDHMTDSSAHKGESPGATTPRTGRSDTELELPSTTPLYRMQTPETHKRHSPSTTSLSEEFTTDSTGSDSQPASSAAHREGPPKSRRKKTREDALPWGLGGGLPPASVLRKA